jgi:putative membrane-bound dehydrogenase-like protein
MFNGNMRLMTRIPRRLAGLVVGTLAVLSLTARVDLAVFQPGVRPGQSSGRTARPMRVLFLGHDQAAPHNPAKMFPILAAPLARKGIQLTYVATPAEALDPARLARYDALMMYGNHTSLPPDQEKALLDFVEGGKGLIALHSASAEFTSSDKFIALVGAQFLRHGAGDFTAEIVQPAHPLMQGLQPFETWDETYVHTKHNTIDRTVLMERVDNAGREPWTWIRTQGKGRVFYTAYGHDERTWSKPAFQTLVERALLWGVSEDARQAFRQLEMPTVTYVDGYNVPNYENRATPPKYQLPFSPEDAAKFIHAPAEFNVELFASEPDITKPIAMAFDEKGRLWVIEALDYPNDVLDGNPGDDRIKILEDTNNDGRADKFTIFADKINLATSLTFANGGVVLSAPPHMLFLKDTNGDDKADVRQVLSTGWGVRDSHAVAASLQYGPDNYVWGTVGYSGFNGTMNGKPMQFTQGAFRFRPDGTGFEYMAQSTNNTWGLGFNETGDVFGSTANGDPSWYLGIPNRFFEGVTGLPGPQLGRGVSPGYQSLAQFTSIHYLTPYIRQVDQQGYYTAGAGHMLYTARAFPKEYWNRIAFVNEPTVHVTGQIAIEPQGAGYVARDAWNLVESAEEWFAPIASMVGPDGAVWIDDWYNFIAQHNPTPQGYSVGKGAAYETSMRDHVRGRIYRVSYAGAPAVKTRSLSRTDPAGLLDALASDNMLWRLHAQRLLVERGQKDVVPQLVALTRNTSVDAIGTNGGAFHALWTLHGLGELNTTETAAYRAAVDALRHPAAGVRKAAAMVLPTTAPAATAMLAAGLLQDAAPHTRLAAVLVAAEMPASAEIAQALLRESRKADNFGDPWLSRAMYVAATKHQAAFLAAYAGETDKVPFGSLPVPLRIGTAAPDWRTPSAQDLAAEWKDMTLPGQWESKGLPNFDGIVWFTRTIDVPQNAAIDALSLGPVRNTGRVWVNGVSLTPSPGGVGAPGSIGGAPALPSTAAVARAADLSFAVPPGVFRPGANTITVQVTNQRAEGGFAGTAAQMALTAGPTRIPLAGAWKYRVERSSNTGALYAKPGELAAHVAFAAAGGATGAAGATLPAVAPVPDVILQLGVIANEMKYSLPELTVAPGQLVEIVFVNADQMPHNFVLGAPGSLPQIGAAADLLAQQPNAAAVSYVPDVAQVIFKTNMVAAGDRVTFQFRAPATPGQYPYLCTYPNHWRLMNGVLNVVMQGRRGGPPPAAPVPGRGRI